MFLDLIIRLKNILFVVFSAIVAVVLNCVLLASLQTKEIHLSQYENLNFDYVASSITPYESDDSYIVLKKPMYFKSQEAIKLIDAKILMEQEEPAREKFYSNLILSETNEKVKNGITITKSIADRFGYKLNDKIFDIKNNTYPIVRIVDDIYHLFGENIEVSSLIILNYDSKQVAEADDKYLAFCNYNDNVYSKFYLRTNDARASMQKEVRNSKIIYSCLLELIFLSYLICCYYQFRLDRAFYEFGFRKLKVLGLRFLCHLINCSIIFIIGLLPLLILKNNATLYLINFAIIFLLINSTNLINILSIKNGKKVIKHVR